MREYDEQENDEIIHQDELQLSELAKRGATMEEIARLREPVARTPDEAVRALKVGNARFYGGRPLRQGYSPVERRSQIIGQTPFAVVLGCSDSRVPTEYVFDQGPGHIFTVRVAGNVVAPSTAGSIEYAVKHLKPHVVVVMGHEGCGAVHAAMSLTEEQAREEPENVRHLIECIAPAVQGLPPIRDAKARMREAVIASVRRQVQQLRLNETVSDALARGQIAVIGAYYEISSGAVDFLESEEDLRVEN